VLRIALHLPFLGNSHGFLGTHQFGLGVVMRVLLFGVGCWQVSSGFGREFIVRYYTAFAVFFVLNVVAVV
jgi:hypothetical protein